MDKKLLPWELGKSIYDYITENTDEEGFFTSDRLPDNSLAATDSYLDSALGDDDAALCLTPEEDSNPLAELILKGIIDYQNNPTEEQAAEFYGDVIETPCVLYYKNLIEQLATSVISPALNKLTKTWLFHSPNREAVKFSIIISALILLNPSSKAESSSLKTALLRLAKCDEFTRFVLFALNLCKQLEQKEVWDIIQHTTGWGKINAMEEYNFSTEAERTWLLCHGCQQKVTYPDISLLVLKEGDIMEHLRKPHISHSIYVGILTTLSTYLVLLLDNEFPCENENIPAPKPLPPFPLSHALDLLIKHSETQASTLEDLEALVNLVDLLKAVIEFEHWEHLSINHTHLLLSAVERLVFSQDWSPLITAELIKPDGSTNTLAANLAQVLSIDVRATLFKSLKKYPQQTDIYSILLQTDNQKSFHSVLNFAKKHLKEYSATEDSLKPILTALIQAKGEGREFVTAGLTSVYDGTRSYALKVLEAWPVEAMTQDIKLSLIKAKAMCQHPLIYVRIQLLLLRKPGIKISPADLFPD